MKSGIALGAAKRTTGPVCPGGGGVVDEEHAPGAITANAKDNESAKIRKQLIGSH
jgi:hypothetical protein